MLITLASGVAFFTGVVAGVFLGERRYVTIEMIDRNGRKIIRKIQSFLNRDKKSDDASHERQT